MRRQAGVKDENRVAVIPEYGRHRLMSCAESFRDLADLFEAEEPEETAAGRAGSRRDYLWQHRLQENRELLAEHFKETAHIMTEMARTTYAYRPVGERKHRRLARLLKESGILLGNFFELEHEDGHREISLTMRMASEKYARFGEQESILVEDVADFLSVAMNVRLRAAGNAPLYLTPEWASYYFLQEPRFQFLTGTAKAVKETEKISGDNYSFYEGDGGRMTVILSDGMGSGEKANRDSERVVELTERLLEAGFRKEAAVQMINGALASSGQEENMSTLDVCDMNLYTGECEFIKVGAACTYIKRGRLVDRLSAQSFPLGVFGQMEPEVMYRTLENGDYVIMLSDGVLDALSQGIGEDVLPEIIGRMDCSGPGEIANQILAYSLAQSKGQIRDDMTVLVLGAWEQDGAADGTYR